MSQTTCEMGSSCLQWLNTCISCLCRKPLTERGQTRSTAVLCACCACWPTSPSHLLMFQSNLPWTDFSVESCFDVTCSPHLRPGGGVRGGGGGGLGRDRERGLGMARQACFLHFVIKIHILYIVNLNQH